MRIVFVRHGHPDYAHDCLTELGRLHARAAAERLMEEGISRIFSSPHGRAMETAQALADRLGLVVEGCSFMREISWGTAQGDPLEADGHPWTTVDRMIGRGQSLLDPDWADREPFRRNTVVGYVTRIGTAVDAWLETLGYRREGLYYRSVAPNGDTVAAFGHGGASSAILSHLFNLPFPYGCMALDSDYTGVTIVTFPEAGQELASPRFEVVNDARHIRDLRVQNVFDK